MEFGEVKGRNFEDEGEGYLYHLGVGQEEEFGEVFGEMEGLRRNHRTQLGWGRGRSSGRLLREKEGLRRNHHTSWVCGRGRGFPLPINYLPCLTWIV